MLRTFPLMIIPVGLYNLFVLGGNVIAGYRMDQVLWTKFTVPMVSRDMWTINVGDFLVLFGVAMLFIEVIKSSGTSRKEMINNALSMLVFVVALVEFIVLKGFATSTFFFLTAMCLFDSIAGPTITAVAAKRDLGIGQQVIDGA
jgi:hypothetical protein